MSTALVTRVWTTQEGEQIPFSRMQTTHLFYVIRMIWNHTAPRHLRLPGGHYPAVETWPVKKRRQTLACAVAELCKRDDLPLTLEFQLGIMRDFCRDLETKRLTT